MSARSELITLANSQRWQVVIDGEFIGRGQLEQHTSRFIVTVHGQAVAEIPEAMVNKIANGDSRVVEIQGNS